MKLMFDWNNPLSYYKAAECFSKAQISQGFLVPLKYSF